MRYNVKQIKRKYVSLTVQSTSSGRKQEWQVICQPTVERSDASGVNSGITGSHDLTRGSNLREQGNSVKRYYWEN